MFFWVTLTCAFAGSTAVHKRTMISDEEEIRVFMDRRLRTTAPLLKQRAALLSSLAAKQFVTITLFFAVGGTRLSSTHCPKHAALPPDICAVGESCAIALRTRRSTFHLATLASFVNATDQPDSLVGFFSGVLVLPGGGLFVNSFGVADFSPVDDVAGASFLAASL